LILRSARRELVRPVRSHRSNVCQLPEGVDANKIEANFKNGMLMVTLPNSAGA
jgi:HSP20 family molecular chaperone IbpA